MSEPSPNVTLPELDVVIVGGSAAGLSAALVLGRCLRKVVVCDERKPRNAPAKIFNGYLSRDGSTPAQFLEFSREQMKRYENVQLRTVKVVDVQRGRERFTTILETGETLQSRMILLATGLIDELPEIENFRQFYGHTVHSCPYCDGWEVRGQPLAVAGSSQEAAELAIELLQWSKDVVLCSNGPLACDPKVQADLQRLKVRVLDTPIARLEGQDRELQRIVFRDGSALERAALFFSPEQYQHSPLAERLGCELCAQDGCVKCGENTSTCVPGVYAAGNCTKGVQLVVAAVAEGMEAAFAINNALIEADAASGALRSGVA